MPDASNPLGPGGPQICKGCGEPYRELSRLPGTVGYCPTCFEEYMGR
jgi:hypothetical protein